MPTRLSLHIAEWSDCRRCSLSERRGRVVLCRGTVPANIMLVGEGAGHSEDALGNPFVGPAGRVLDDVLEKSIPSTVTYAITNLVGCIPLDEHGVKAVEPPEEAIIACAPRLLQFVGIVRPKLIVAVGTLAHDWLPSILSEWSTVPRVHIVHPAYIIRQPRFQQQFSVNECVVTLRRAVAEHFGGSHR